MLNDSWSELSVKNNTSLPPVFRFRHAQNQAVYPPQSKTNECNAMRKQKHNNKKKNKKKTPNRMLTPKSKSFIPVITSFFITHIRILLEELSHSLPLPQPNNLIRPQHPQTVLPAWSPTNFNTQKPNQVQIVPVARVRAQHIQVLDL